MDRSDPIPFITLPNWVQAAAQCGFNIQPIFESVGVQTDLLHLEEARITVGQLARIMEACVERSPQLHFPLVLGETFAFDYLPDINLFLTTSPSLREAFRVLEWVRELVNPMIQFRLEESGDRASLLLLSPTPEPSAVERYFTESIFAAVLKFGRLLAGGELERRVRLRFRFPAPEYATRYERYFPGPIAFSQPCDALDLPRDVLDQTLRGGFPRLHEQAAQRVIQRLRQARQRSGLAALIEAAIEREPKCLSGGIEAVAMRLNLHPRTLQRRLQQQGETFAEVQDRARYRLALRALQESDLDIERISERLGFSDRRSFTRAFSRWSGVSPSEYRKRVSAGS